MNLPIWTAEDENCVAFVGDWHGNRTAIQQGLISMKLLEPSIRTVLHVGDFGIMPGYQGKGVLVWVDRVCASLGIDQVLVTPGNHEDWARLDRRFANRPGEPAKLSRRVWALPRGYRCRLGNRTVMSFGGAVSIDRSRRTEGQTWWASETPTDEEVEQAIAGGPVDIMISHDAVDGGTRQVQAILDRPLPKWAREARPDADRARARVTRVWDAVRPGVLVHGHFHVDGEVTLADGRRVYSLAAEDDVRSSGILRLADLVWTWGT